MPARCIRKATHARRVWHGCVADEARHLRHYAGPGANGKDGGPNCPYFFLVPALSPVLPPLGFLTPPLLPGPLSGMVYLCASLGLKIALGYSAAEVSVQPPPEWTSRHEDAWVVSQSGAVG